THNIEIDNKMSQLKTLALVTGASKGFGVAICQELAKRIPSIDFVLYARSREGLQSTETIIKQIRADSKVSLVTCDFGDISTLEQSFKQSIDQTTTSGYQRYLLINNHGSLGSIEFTEKYVVGLPSLLVERDTNKTTNIQLQGLPINRQLLQKSTNNIKAFSWSPGPMDTDMQVTIRTQSVDEESKKMFTDLYTNNQLVNVNQSAGLMLDVMLENTYTSGVHLAYGEVSKARAAAAAAAAATS
ncbi:hypothetical protein SAMD00019534_009980, partial [Acytostelium subglobosum LB1]|uniref:hypothetical protein n=1 Tax=Acytostelium subglobosum LB1 TaxID=1410327 RepID=UPI000644A30E